MKVVIALGGNAFSRPAEPITQEGHLRNVEAAARVVYRIIQEGHRVLVTHGNGPQVGFFVELQKDRPAFLLDSLTAATQGLLGYLIVSALDKYLGRGRSVAVVTRVEVDCDDPAFKDPTKFIGSLYTEEEAKALAEKYGWVFKRDPRGGMRRVVPSPTPLKVVEMEAIRQLFEEGFVVVAGGGGGVPTCDGRGVEGVVDKDLASALIAAGLGADFFIILTDVDGVYLNYGKPNQKKLATVRVDELEKYYYEGHFPPGSMGPKVLAAINFIRRGGKKAAIGALEEGYEVFKGEKGTQILR
ncbi:MULTISPECIES: carbamate kinase [Pyrobaculum]|uniref:Carbamate kinase n=3 Tax=Pyrobaculum TaxID=2276 RepID=A4WIN3_PYRAR|nr:carbamate kinase [Pyrobaculum arsenaticum]ABP50250.1 carbamate kinase [Pyrobaculum arsenaticum DSM 13514]AFA39724.1 Carbamate kinase [Pyrobaculum oguniense TE7]MCY0889854.1 carbamate kinase [Pyrobaculum arsenaticum]NYR14813.1 carbamate kinase [Pyrobaculum arsenaticum]